MAIDRTRSAVSMLTRIVLALVVALAALAVSTAYALDPSQPNIKPDYKPRHGKTAATPDEIVVQFSKASAPSLKSAARVGTLSSGLDAIDRVNREFGALSLTPAFPSTAAAGSRQQAVDRYGISRTYVIKVAAGTDLDKAIAAYQATPGVVSAERNGILTADAVPNDTFYPFQWGLHNTGNALSYPSGTLVGTPGADINVQPAWDLHTGSSGDTLAIIDTGVDYNHPEFAGRIVPGYDFIDNDSDPMDVQGHGTCCAGIAAADANNSALVAGVNWNVKIMPVRVLGASGAGTDVTVANGIVWAADHGAKVLSLSLGGGGSTTMSNAVDYAHDLGCTILAARGNDDDDYPHYPASYPKVIAVGALSPCNERKSPTTCDGEYWWGSSYGADLDFMAPGTRIVTTDMLGAAGFSSDDYDASFNGTSAATPFAAGVAALIHSYAPSLSNDEIRDVMRSTAVDIDAPGFDNNTGYGRLNAAAALNFAATFVPAQISLSDVAYNFSILPDANDQRTLTISNVAPGATAGTLHWSISYDAGAAPWLALSAASGATAAGHADAVQLTANTFAMIPGDYTSTLTVSSNDRVAPATQVVVHLTVLFAPPAQIGVSPSSLSFALANGFSDSAPLSIANTAPLGNLNLHWSASIQNGSAWMSLGNASGVTGPSNAAVATVYVNSAGLTADTYRDTIRVTSTDPSSPLVLVPVELVVNAPPVTGPNLYVFVSGNGAAAPPAVTRLDLDGTHAANLFTGHTRPIDGAVATISRKLYWIDWGAGTPIYRGDLDGTHKEVVISGTDLPLSLAIDETNGYIYFITDHYPDRLIHRRKLDGSADTVLYHMSGQNENGLSLDLGHGKMYWCQGFNTNHPEGVWRANLDGSNAERLIVSTVDPFGLALDLVHGKMYWGENSSDLIRRANLDGSSPETVLPVADLRNLVLDVAGGKLYWSALGWNGSSYVPLIARSNLDGTGSETLLQSASLQFPKIAIDPTPAVVNTAVDVTTTPAGLGINVDGTAYVSPQSFQWAPGSSHTIATTSPQSLVAGTQYAFTSWSDAGAISHSVTAPGAPTTYTAAFATQHLLTTSANPVAGGTVAPATGYLGAGDVVVTATPNAGFLFLGFTGAVTGATNPQTLHLTAPAAVVANFVVDPAVVPTAAATSPDAHATGGTSQLIIVLYGDDAGINTGSLSDGDLSVVGPGGPIAVHFVGFSGSGTAVTATYTMVPPGGSWDIADAGAYAIQMVANEVFDADASPHAVPAGPIGAFSALTQVAINVTTAPAGLGFTVDGTGYTTAQAFFWVPGSSHTISSVTPQGYVAGTQYVFGSWSDAGAISHSVTAPADTTAYTANFKTQFMLTTTANPAAGGTISPATGFADSADVTISATPNPGYNFSGFTGALAGTTNPATLHLVAPASVTANFVALIPGFIDNRVAANSDDAEESAAGNVSLTSNDLELVYDGSLQTVGMRFRGVTIPRGATITRAWVQFQAVEKQSEATVLTIQGQAFDSAPTFTSSLRNVSTRARTTASVPWPPAAWSVIGQTGPAQQTPDLKSVVQEIVNRGGWASGNALALIVTGTGHRTARSYDGGKSGAPLLHVEFAVTPEQNRAPVVRAGSRETVTLPAQAELEGAVTDDGITGTLTLAWAKQSGPGTVTFSSPNAAHTKASFSAPGSYLLRLTANDGLLSASDSVRVDVLPWTLERRVSAGSDDAEEGATGSTSLTSNDLELVYDGSLQTVGIRFRSILVPRGATILRAWVQFQAVEKQSEATALTIQGQAFDSAPTFASSARNVSTRARTTASVAWSPAAWNVIGQTGAAQQTPELRSVIQEIVNRNGWASGNALALIVTGTGHRTARSYDGSGGGAPLLHLEYQLAAATTVSQVVAPIAREGAIALAPTSLRIVPSPMRAHGSIQLTLAQAGAVKLELYDVQGRRLSTLIDEHNLSAGAHQVSLGAGLQPGLYFARLQAPDRSLVARVMVVE